MGLLRAPWASFGKVKANCRTVLEGDIFEGKYLEVKYFCGDAGYPGRPVKAVGTPGLFPQWGNLRVWGVDPSPSPAHCS